MCLISSPSPSMARARAVFSRYLCCWFLQWEMESRCTNRNMGRPSPLLGKKGWNQQWCQELALFPPMPELLHMIDVNPKQSQRKNKNAFSVLSIVSVYSVCCFILVLLYAFGALSQCLQQGCLKRLLLSQVFPGWGSGGERKVETAAGRTNGESACT